jgi:hypothetical protein
MRREKRPEKKEGASKMSKLKPADSHAHDCAASNAQEQNPMNVTALPPRDPIFALAPELKLHSDLGGALLVNSREVARVFFPRRHRRLLRKIMEDIWDMPMQPNLRDYFRLRGDGTIDMTPNGLAEALSHWGLGFTIRNKRLNEFNSRWAKLVCATAKGIEAKTGINPITERIKKCFPRARSLRFTHDGDRCCDDCHLPEGGPMLHDDLWATIAEPHNFLCFGCTEKRLGRPLTQGDLIVCPFNAGWVNFDGADVVAMQFARGRQLLPV